MHLCDTASQTPNPLKIIAPRGDRFSAFVRTVRCCVQIYAEPIGRPSPGIAAIRHIGVDDAEGIARGRMSRLKVANECGRMGKIRRLRKKLPHFDFRILARLDVAIQLDDIVLVNQGGTVGLLTLNRANKGGGIERWAPELAGRLEVQPPPALAMEAARRRWSSRCR